MDPVRPPTGPVAPQAVAKVVPVGRGWMLLAVDAGFVLRSAAQGLDVSLTREDAEALRRGEVTPEALAARAGPVHQPPPGAVTVAFSAEAMRLSGQMGAGKGSGKAGVPPGKVKVPVPLPPLPLGWIGAGCLALLVFGHGLDRIRRRDMARKAAIIGGGVIGGGWAARFLLNGWDVAVFDPDPEAPRKVGEVLANARKALPALSDGPMPAEGRISFVGTITEAVEGADYIQESVSERLDLKHRVFAQIQQVAPDTPIGSSTSGFKPSELQQNAANPATIFVAHPFNPVYLLPLAEVVPSPESDPALIEAAKETLREIGMFPLHVRKEIDAHIADRFLEAVWREALWLVKDGIATTEEIDEAIRMGFGLRWGQMGLFETYRVAGGEAGMKHFMAQFGPCLTWPWTKLMDVPEFNDELVDLIAGQSDAQSGMHTIRELERIRDQNLIGFLRVLKERNWGAGKVLLEHDARRKAAMPAPIAGEGPMEMARLTVLPGWIDYNGHMTESRYLFCASETSDAFLRHIGADVAYVGTGFSYYTAETHIMHLGEAKLGDALTGTVQVLHADEKRLHLFIRILKDGQAVATLEQMLLHVDMAAGKTCAAPAAIQARLMPVAAAHAALPRPEAAGRAVGQKK